MNVITDHAYDSALSSHGLPRPSTRASADESRTALSNAAFKVARRLLDMLRVVSSQKTLQPEHVHNLARLSELLSSSVSASASASSNLSKNGSRKSPVHSLRGGAVLLPGSYFDPDNTVDASRYSTANASDFSQTYPDAPGSDGVRYGLNATTGGASASKSSKTRGGAVLLPGSYFDPTNALDASRYSTANASDFSQTYPDAPGADGTVRYGLDASSNFPVGGGGSKAWLTDDALASLIKEYKSRSGASDLRVSEGAKTIIRRVVEINLDGIIKASLKGSSSSSKKKTLSGGALTKTANGWILKF